MKKVIKIVLLPSLLSSFGFAIEIKNLSVAVDVAGKQRMFTQRMLKDYAMVGLENNFGNPGEDLKKIMGSFDNHLQSLRKFNTDPATEKSLAKVRVLWDPITNRKSFRGNHQYFRKTKNAFSKNGKSLYVKSMGDR
jgi:hypothetical protein